jgi:hypothetical protein
LDHLPFVCFENVSLSDHIVQFSCFHTLSEFKEVEKIDNATDCQKDEKERERKE